MLLFALAFIVIVSISFILALRSVRHYRERPEFLKAKYALFLIQHPNLIDQGIFGEKLMLSFERLQKGNRRALVVFGPQTLSRFATQLGLVELEDYTHQLRGVHQCFEIGLKPGRDLGSELRLDFDQLELAPSEQLWWQVVLQPGSKVALPAVLRLVFFAQDQQRLAIIQHRLTILLAELNLTILPTTFSYAQIFEFYKNRAFAGVIGPSPGVIQLSFANLRSLLGVS